MNKQFQDIEIESDDSLLEACDFLHDANCDISRISFDKSTGIWQAVFTRELFNESDLIIRNRKFFVFEKILFPVTHCVLMLSGVDSFSVEDKSRLKRVTFNECRIKNNTYEFDFCEDMKICLTFHSRPSGQLKDLYFMNKKNAMWTIVNPFRKRSLLRLT